MNQNPETNQPHPAPHPIEELRLAREYLAEQQAASMLLKAFSPPFIEEVGSGVTAATLNGAANDEAVITASTLLSMEALGIDTATTLGPPANNYGVPTEKIITTRHFEDQKLTIKRYRQGLSYRLESCGPISPPDQQFHPSFAVRQAVLARFVESPAHRAVLATREQMMGAPSATSAYTEPFPYLQDPLGTIVFLSNIGLITEESTTRQLLQQNMSPQAIVEWYLDHISPTTAVCQRQDDQLHITWGKGLKKELLIDTRQQTCVFRAATRFIDLYLEQAHESPDVNSLPFVETECAEQLTTALAKAGLMFHPNLQLAMIEPGIAERFGSIYTQITRHIGEWINKPATTALTNLLVPFQREFSAQCLAANHWEASYRYKLATHGQEAGIEAKSRRLYEQVDFRGHSQAADTLLQLIAQCLERSKQTTQAPSDLPVSLLDIAMPEGGCCDVTAYYIMAAAQIDNVRLRQVTPEGVPLLEKTYGYHTFLTRQPTIFNGIHLPKGALLVRAKDKGWGFLRLTPFSFDHSADQLVFGSETSKALANLKTEHTMAHFGIEQLISSSAA